MANVSSTTTSTSTSAYSAHGLSGLASGLDTESMVQAMLVGTQNRIDAQNQKIQVLEWKQSQYRDITKSLLNLQNSYFSFSSGTTNLRTAAFFDQLTLNSTNSAISVTNSTANADVSFTINSVKQLATASKLMGKTNVSGNLVFNINPDKWAEVPKDNKKISLSLDGVSKDFVLEGDNVEDVVTNLNEDLKAKFGDNVKAVYDEANKKLEFVTYDYQRDDDGKIKTDAEGNALVTISNNRKVSVTANNTELKAFLGATENTNSNKIQLGLSAASQNINGLTAAIRKETQEVTTTNDDGTTTTETKEVDVGYYKFSINGEEFEFESDTSITAIMQKINASNADVNMAYDSLNDRFTLTSKTTGAGVDIELEDLEGSNFLKSVFGEAGNAGYKKTVGDNAILEINGLEVERNTNSFDVEGVLVTLNSTTTEAAKVTGKSNTDDIVKGITDFVKAYNEMITSVIKKTTESADYADYPALTEAQKKEMSEEEIEKWEAKAKTGLLRGDATLRGMLSNFRSVLYLKDEGGLALYDIGITTNTDGTLKVDENKVKEMCKTNLEGVKNLFVGNGEIATDASGNKKAAASNGLAGNINLMLDRYAKTSSASAGILVKKAGYENTASDSDTGNSIAKEIKSLKEYLERLQDKYDSERSRYWKKFTSLEKLISNGNSVSSYFASMSGGYY